MIADSRRARSTIVSTSDELVVGVGAAADRTEAVERRDAERRGEVAVAATADRHAGDRGQTRRRQPRLRRPRTASSMRTPASAGARARRSPRHLRRARRTTASAISCSTRSFSPRRDHARVDTDAWSSPARRCRRCPPWPTVGVTVVPVSGSPNVAIRAISCAAATSELMPFSGSSPACAARPCTATSNVPVPLRPVFNAPPSALGSSTSTAPHASARSSISARDAFEPTSSSAVISSSTPSTIVEQRQRVDRQDDARPSCRTRRARWPGRRRPRTAARPTRPSGNTVSWWPTMQHPRRRAEPGSGRAARRRSRRAPRG